MILVTVEFLMLGQQLHIRHVALLHRHGTQLAKENAPRTAPMVAGFLNRSAQSEFFFPLFRFRSSLVFSLSKENKASLSGGQDRTRANYFRALAG